MATERLGGKGNGRGKKKDAPEAPPAEGGAGHNLTSIKQATEDAFRRLQNLDREFESTKDDYADDKETVFEEAAKATGISVKILKQEYGLSVAHRKRMAREAKKAASERDQIDAVRASLEGTAFGDYFATKLEEMKAAGV